MININDIKSPDFLKQLNIDELNNLCDEIRKVILEKVSLNGGHLSSNLGVIELTVALHYVFDAPRDKIIFDVGHQTYAHKILTGRIKGFDNLRSRNGVSGFPKYSESQYDCFEVGHSSTSISAMLGFIEARKVNKDINKIIAVIGDGSIENGLALSSLNYLSSLNNKEQALIIINDNEMAIGESVGGLSKTFNKMRINKSYNNFKKNVPVNIKKLLRPFKNKVFNMIYRKDFSLGNNIKYIGPIDGHNIRLLIEYLKYCKNYNGPVILHVKTIKGKGYKFAEDDKIGLYHGVSKFNLNDGYNNNSNDDNFISYSNLAVNAVSKYIDNNEELKDRIRVITPGMLYGTGLYLIKDKYQDKIIDMGIQEEASVVSAAAMSRNGLIPFIFTYSTFIQRAYDQINHDVARSNNHVIFMLDRAGIVSGDGDTHQGIFDLGLFNMLPNVVIANPSNKSEMNDLVELAVTNKCPFVIRYPKGNVRSDITSNKINTIGKWNIVKDIKNINIITYSNYVNEFKTVIEEDESLNNIGLINSLFVKPIDLELLNKLHNKTIIIYEDVIEKGSLGEEIIKYNYSHKAEMNIICYNVKDYVETGTLDEIKSANNLNIKNVIELIKKYK